MALLSTALYADSLIRSRIDCRQLRFILSVDVTHPFRTPVLALIRPRLLSVQVTMLPSSPEAVAQREKTSFQ